MRRSKVQLVNPRNWRQAPPRISELKQYNIQLVLLHVAGILLILKLKVVLTVLVYV